MNRSRKYFFILLILLILCSAGAYAETLHIGVEEWAPWIIREGDSFTGIAVEICREAVRRAGHDSVILEIPQKRRDLKEWGGKVDVEPGCDKSWRVSFDSVSVYTDPYIETRDVIISRRDEYPPTSTIETFYDERIGGSLGYYYTDGFSEAFEQGKIIRDDSRPGSSLIKKLVHKRLKAAVVDTHEWKYWMGKMGRSITDYEESYRFSHLNMLRIRLHKDKKHLVEPLNRALESMKEDKTIDKIVKKYIAD